MFKELTDSLVCPSSSQDADVASRRLGCFGLKKYHCMRNQLGRLGEICLGPSWIQKGYCPEYNTVASRLDAEKCNEREGICPQKTFLSHEVLSYSACLQESENSTTIALMTSTSMPEASNELDAVAIVIILVFVMIITAACVIFGIAFLKRRRRPRGETTETEMNSAKSTSPLLKQEITFHLTSSEGIAFFDDNSEFVETRAFRAAKDTLLSSKHVVVVGQPGTGKTTLAWHACRAVHNRKLRNKTFRFRVYSTLEKAFEQEPDDDVIEVFFLDNCFDEWNTFPKRPEIDKKFFAKVEENKISNRLLLVMTISKYTYDSHPRILAELFERYDPLLPEFKIIDVSSNQFAINAKEIILVAHAAEKDMQNKILQSNNTHGIVLNHFSKLYECSMGRIGFPLAWKLYLELANFYAINDVAAFFKDPFPFITDVVRNLLKVKPFQYCTLLFAVLKGGYIDECEGDEILLTNIGKALDIETPTIELNASFMCEISAGKIEFFHEFLFRSLFVIFGEDHQELVIRESEPNSLLKYTRVYEEDGENNYAQENYLVITSTEMMEMLAKRFARIHQEIPITGHISLKGEFAKLFEKYLESNSNETSNHADRTEL